MVLAQSQSSYGNYIVEHAIILDPTRQLTKPMAIATQPRPMPCFKLNFLLLMHINDGAFKSFMSMGQISEWFHPLHRKC
jgi:hypothetical protein